MEAVGLALALVPLIVGCIDNYKKALKPFRRYARFEAKLDGWKGSVLTQQTLWVEEVKLLLCKIMERSEVRAMLNDRHHQRWTDPQTETSIRNYLGSSYEAVSLTCKSISALGSSIREYVESFESVAKASNENMSKKEKLCKRQIAKKLRICFSDAESHFECELKQLADRNMDFQTLLKQRRSLDRIENEHKSEATAPRLPCINVEKFKLVQKEARDLYEILGNSCNRHERHDAHFSLEPIVEFRQNKRVWFDVVLRRPTFECASLTEKSMAFAVEYFVKVEAQGGEPENICRGTYTRNGSRQKRAAPDEPTTLKAFDTVASISASGIVPDPSGKRFKAKTVRFIDNYISKKGYLPDSVPRSPSFLRDRDLCNHLLLWAQKHNVLGNTCIGCLEEDSSREVRFYICPPKSDDPCHRTVDFNAAITMIKAQREGGRLSEYERYRAARILASAALQLNNTPWLGYGSWRDRITFMLGGVEQAASDACLLPVPYMDVALQHDHQQLISGGCENSPRPWIPSLSLFNLSCLLIELALETPMAKLWLATDGDCGTNALDTEYATASRLLDAVGRRTCRKYQAVVEKCLRSSYGDFSSEPSQQNFHSEVVSELEGLEKFFGELCITA